PRGSQYPVCERRPGDAATSGENSHESIPEIYPDRRESIPTGVSYGAGRQPPATPEEQPGEEEPSVQPRIDNPSPSLVAMQERENDDGERARQRQRPRGGTESIAKRRKEMTAE